MVYITDQQLDEYLREHALVTAEDLERAIQDAKKFNTSLYEALLHLNLQTHDQLCKAQADIEHVPYVDLAREAISFETLNRVPEAIARRNFIIAFREDASGVSLATSNIHNVAVFDALQKMIGLPVYIYAASESALQEAFVQYRKSLNAEFGDLIHDQVTSLDIDHDDSVDEASEPELKKMAEDVPIIKIVDTLISHAILQSASDIHIEPEEELLMVRYRTDGILHDAMELPKKISQAVIVRMKVLANLRLDEKRLPQDGRFKTTFNDQDVSFRVSTLPTYFGEKVVIRILRESAHGLGLEQLGFHGEGLEEVHKAMRQKTGLILVSGPTGSGKTTTLYTMLDILNTTDVNISTVEDPIEYQVDRINQTQVQESIGLTFAAGLRSLLRQDPDILMVGEIRDKETVSLAVNAALTGHLVLSTIHTNSASGVIPRMIDMGIESFLITSTIKTITAQRLVRVLTENKEAYILSAQERAQLEQLVRLDHVLATLKREKIIGPQDTWETISFYKPVPTELHPSGFSGRIGIHEVLTLDSDMRHAITQGATEEEIEGLAKKRGMLTMIEDGIFKAVQGVTSVEEVLRVISD
jgi:type IV pilus assembly protein PilB